MSANLISSIAQVLSSDVIARIASSLGIDRSQADKAMQAGIPGLLAAIVSLVSRPGGASALNGAIAQQQPALLSNLSKVVGGPTQNNLIDGGTSTLNSLLGSSTTALLTNAVGQYVGLGGNASKNILGLLAPVIMGVLGHEQRTNGLDADGVADLLESQKDNITRALPAGFSKYLGGTGILDSLMGDERAASTASATSSRPGYTASSAGRYAVDPNVSSSQWRWVPSGAGGPGAAWHRLEFAYGVVSGTDGRQHTTGNDRDTGRVRYQYRCQYHCAVEYRSQHGRRRRRCDASTVPSPRQFAGHQSRRYGCRGAARQCGRRDARIAFEHQRRGFSPSSRSASLKFRQRVFSVEQAPRPAFARRPQDGREYDRRNTADARSAL